MHISISCLGLDVLFFVFQVFGLTKFAMPNNGSCPRLQPNQDRYLDRLQVPYFAPSPIQYLSLQCLSVCISVYVLLCNRLHSLFKERKSQPCQLKAFNLLASLKERGETWDQYQPKVYKKYICYYLHMPRDSLSAPGRFFIFISFKGHEDTQKNQLNNKQIEIKLEHLCCVDLYILNAKNLLQNRNPEVQKLWWFGQIQWISPSCEILFRRVCYQQGYPSIS